MNDGVKILCYFFHTHFVPSVHFFLDKTSQDLARGGSHPLSSPAGSSKAVGVMSSGTSPHVLYRRILKRVAKLESIGVDAIHFRRPVSYREVLSGPNLSRCSLDEQWQANLNKALPWLVKDARTGGAIATDGLRAIARRHFEGGLLDGAKGAKSSSWLTRALDAYICLISQTRLAFCASVDSVPAAGGSVRVEAWSSGIDSPFASSPSGGDDENHHFAYRVRLENATNKEIELVGRRLEVTNSEGKPEKLIPGYQPIHGGGGSLVGASINPGEVFEYASHTSLTTESGVCRCSFALRCFEDEDDEDEDDPAEGASLGDVLPHTARILAAEDPDTSDPARGLPPSASDTRTHGIRVKVASKYVPERSTPRLGKFFFTYKVSPLASCVVSPPTPIFPSFLA